ncbi:hypothetical protein STEG23_021849 [Scotinomys teguina]
MKFAGKWKELENIILSEVTLTQKDKHDDQERKGCGLTVKCLCIKDTLAQPAKTSCVPYPNSILRHICPYLLAFRVSIEKLDVTLTDSIPTSGP